MIRRGALGALVFAVVAGCSQAVSPSLQLHEVGVPADVELRVGEELVADSVLRIGFSGVSSDSRCPSQVMCVWAGDAAAAITRRLGTGPAEPDTLHTTTDPKTIIVGAYLVTLVQVSPYPAQPGAIPQDEYVLRLRVERINR